MNKYKKPPLGISPRHFWLHDRTRECIEALYNLDFQEDYDKYREKAKELAVELLYATTEWEKYYKEVNE